MKSRLSVMLCVMLIALPPMVHAAPPPIAQTEINYLLAFVGKSGCEFYRNGSWYDPRQAQAHLRYKYEAAAVSNRMNSAEDFIEKVGTKSSLSGQLYQIRCDGGDRVTSNQWLHDVLTNYRINGTPP